VTTTEQGRAAARAARPCAPRRLPPLPPEATNGDRAVAVTAYNHRCPIGRCMTWVPNHRVDCGEHGAP
jgi:hypothetical protein